MSARDAARPVLVSGASGLIGGALVRRLDAERRAVRSLTRRASGAPSDVLWDPERGALTPSALEGLDAVVHLAGESIGEGRWTAAKRARIVSSRVAGTRLLCAALAALAHPPRVLISASAVGWYGDRGDERLTEESARGAGFLADVAEAWEQATGASATAGIRVVKLRIGIVLARTGGALEPLQRLFRLGLGGRLGNGRQWMSWIAIGDLVDALLHLIARDDVAGVVNATSPAPVTNAEFTATLGRVLGRPAWLPAPAFALRAVLGRERADQLLLASQRVEPSRLLASGFTFRTPRLEEALRAVLGAKRNSELTARTTRD